MIRGQITRGGQKIEGGVFQGYYLDIALLRIFDDPFREVQCVVSASDLEISFEQAKAILKMAIELNQWHDTVDFQEWAHGQVQAMKKVETDLNRHDDYFWQQWAEKHES